MNIVNAYVRSPLENASGSVSGCGLLVSGCGLLRGIRYSCCNNNNNNNTQHNISKVQVLVQDMDHDHSQSLRREMDSFLRKNSEMELRLRRCSGGGGLVSRVCADSSGGGSDPRASTVVKRCEGAVAPRRRLP